MWKVFEEKWLRKKAKELRRNPQPNYGSLKLLEQCLIGLDFEEDHARSIVAPLHKLHDLRNKLSAHATNEKAQMLKKEAIKEHGSYLKHYKNLATDCDESMRTLVEALQDSGDEVGIIETSRLLKEPPMKKDKGSKVPDSLRTLLDEVADRLWSGQTAVMVGAGFSKNAYPSLPDSDQLGDFLYEKIHGKKPDDENRLP